MPNPNKNLEILRLTPENLTDLKAFSDRLGLSKDVDYFDKTLELQAQNRREVFLGYMDNHLTSYVVLNWYPRYGLFKTLNVPEIQDLNVDSAQRRQGIATALIHHCESLAQKKGHHRMGISFGMDASYGPAQSLYVRLGYVPDGQGITYDRVTIAHGEMKPVDDLMCLMLVKDL